SLTRFGSRDGTRQIAPQGFDMKQATTTGTGKYEALLERCRGLNPVPTAVAHPCEASALAGAVEAAQKKLIVPILVGPADNIAATLEDKMDICQNAIDLAISLGVKTPKVAILAAVETVTSKMPATLDAAALCRMADRGQIKGGMLDGPLAFDNAISKEAAKTKGIASEVGGDPDILLAPDLEAGNILAKQLSFLANADSAGLVLGAKVPIILTSRADSVRSRIASCAVASLAAHARRK